MRVFILGLVMSVLVVVGLLSMAAGQASSSGAYRIVCYSFAGTVIYDGIASSYSTGMTGTKIRQTNGKAVETQLATCIATEQ